MNLPKIQTPIFSINIPSLKCFKKFRPFLVKEEKLLLIAQQGNDSDLLEAIVQIINNCCLEELDIRSLASFDLEYIFLKLRSRSVNNIVELKYRDNEDNKIYTFEIDLDSIEIQFDDKHTNKIKVNDDFSILMKYPSVELPQFMKDVETEEDVFYRMIIHCIDKIYTSDEIFLATDHTYEELKDFVDNLDVPTFEKIQTFFETMPKLYHSLEYKNSKGSDRTIHLRSLRDFFM